MFRGVIYRHWLINDKGIEKSYVGQTYQQTVEQRWNNGKGYLKDKDGKDADHNFARAIKKYGWDNFNHEVIGVVEADTKEQLILDLDEWEKYYIEKYDSFYNGYNSTSGGQNGRVVNEETKQKQSEAHKGRQLGSENPNAKKVICLNTLQVFDTSKDAGAWCGIKNYSDIGISCKGIRQKTAGVHPISKEKLVWMFLDDFDNSYMSEKEIDEYIKERQKQKKHDCKGNKNSNAKAIICLETKQIFITIKEAIKWCGLNSNTISTYLAGKTNYAGKHPITKEPLHWMYYEDYLNQNENSDSNVA